MDFKTLEILIIMKDESDLHNNGKKNVDLMMGKSYEVVFFSYLRII